MEEALSSVLAMPEKNVAGSGLGQRPPSRLRRHHDRCTQIAADLLHRPSRQSRATTGQSGRRLPRPRNSVKTRSAVHVVKNLMK